MTRQQGYRQLNKVNHSNGNSGEHPYVTQEKALQFCIRKMRRGAVLTAGLAMTKRGQLAMTLALVIGHQVIQSPSLEGIAAGMGVVTAAHWLIDNSRAKGSSVSYDERSITQCQDDPDANSGNWGL